MKLRNEQGSILMEFILVMPVLVLLIFGIAQFSLIWVARLMTYYAAYSGARTAIVYHPEDYSAPDRGPVHRAACVALSWIGMSAGGNGVEVPGWGSVPGSGDIGRQVRISVEEMQQRGIPAVKVTVHFEFPLLIPYAGEIIAYMAGGHESYQWDVTGFSAADIVEKLEDGRYMKLSESCIMPRPWSTATFPKAAAGDRATWGL